MKREDTPESAAGKMLPGLFSRVFERSLEQHINSEIGASVKLINKCKTPISKNEISDGVLILARDLLGRLTRDLECLQKAGGGWPLVTYSDAIQRVMQPYTRFLSSNIFRCVNV